MITLLDISFTYENSSAGVFGINFQVAPGECVVLTGRSGNGKTTLTRIVNGLAPQHYPGSISGHIMVDGKDVVREPLWRMGKTIGSVFQDPQSQFFSSELAGEVAFACENYGYEKHELTRQTDTAIEIFGLDHLRKRPLDLLSSGEKQKVAIASVYALRPKVYICDEPTANLDDVGSRNLAETLLRLKAEGNTLVIAEHRISWLAGIADRIVCLEKGHIIWQRTPEEMRLLSAEEESRFGLRSFNPVARPQLKLPSGSGVANIAAKALCCKRKGYTIVKDMEFAAWAGQVVALVGKNGIGKTTFAKALSGLTPQNAGTIALNGKVVSRAVRRGRVWYSDNDTGTQFFTNSVSEEMLLCSDRSEKTLAIARQLLQDLDLYSFKDAHPAILSGGQKQRLSIACGLLSQREVLIFDEPTSGLDGYNLRLVSKVFCDLARQGRCVLVITHDDELIRECCTHIFDFNDFDVADAAE